MSLRFNDSHEFRARLLADPTLFAQDIDLIRELVLFLHLSREDYQRASFLDGRIVTPQSRGTYIRYAELDAALAGAAPTLPVHFIFHSGHVGSTLLSRLIEAAPGVLALREPGCLRALAEAELNLGAPESLVSPERFELLLRAQTLLWSRAYPDTRASVVKATSTTSSLGSRLMTIAPDMNAICLNLALEPYLATLLAGENSHLDLRGHGPGRMRRLSALLGAPVQQPLHAMSLGELAAMAWTVETLTHARLQQHFGPRVLRLDFDAVLADVDAALGAACAHFGVQAPDTAAIQPLMHTYSKAPDQPYSPDVRRTQLDTARRTRADEIRKGLLWAETFARQAPALGGLLT